MSERKISDNWEDILFDFMDIFPSTLPDELFQFLARNYHVPRPLDENIVKILDRTEKLVIDNLDGLLNECAGIPMVVGLDESAPIESSLTVNGPNQNLWFETINK